MKVYVITLEGYDCYSIINIATEKEKAIEFAKQNVADQQSLADRYYKEEVKWNKENGFEDEKVFRVVWERESEYRWKGYTEWIVITEMETI